MRRASIPRSSYVRSATLRFYSRKSLVIITYQEELEGVKPDCVILAVAHEQFRLLCEGELAKTIKYCPVVVDVKGMLGKCRNLTL
jgi:UDP-N-acetyl-D-mannosaminuronate dehydrogenase